LYFKLSYSKFAKDLQNTQNPNTQKIENPNSDLNSLFFLGAYVWLWNGCSWKSYLRQKNDTRVAEKGHFFIGPRTLARKSKKRAGKWRNIEASNKCGTNLKTTIIAAFFTRLELLIIMGCFFLVCDTRTPLFSVLNILENIQGYILNRLLMLGNTEKT
jgi:hypothetical protein